MAKIKWTEQDLDDVEAITAYIARDSAHYARLFTQKVFKEVERLRSFPKSGRVVPEINKNDIREIIFGNYRIIYRLKKRQLKFSPFTILLDSWKKISRPSEIVP